MPQHLFTPLLTASYDSELSLFALDTRAWYAIQLIELAIAAVVVFACFRLWVASFNAAGAALLFIAGVPLCNVATELMLMHYVESIALAGLSLLAFVHGLRSSRRALLLLSAFLYFAAMLAKEIAIPLPLLLCVLPERDLKVRVRALVPHAALFLAYATWRWTMLGTLFGGYGWAVTNVWALIASLPMKIAGALHLAPLLIMLIGVIAALRSRGGIALAIIGLIIAVAPIAPMAAHMEQRFAVAPWLWWCASFAGGCAALRPRISYVLIAAAVMVVLVANRQEWRAQFGSSRRMSEEGRLFFSLGPGTLLRNPLIPPAAINELKWLKEDYQHRPGGSGWFYDDLFLCNGGATGKRVWQYDHVAQSIVEVTNRIPMISRSYCRAVHQNAPLTAEFHFRDGTLSWRFGPYRDGLWRVVMGDGVQAFDLPAADAFRLGELPGISLRVRYQSPQRWVTYSPELTLDFVNHRDFQWHR